MDIDGRHQPVTAYGCKASRSLSSNQLHRPHIIPLLAIPNISPNRLGPIPGVARSPVPAPACGPGHLAFAFFSLDVANPLTVTGPRTPNERRRADRTPPKLCISDTGSPRTARSVFRAASDPCRSSRSLTGTARLNAFASSARNPEKSGSHQAVSFRLSVNHRVRERLCASSQMMQ